MSQINSSILYIHKSQKIKSLPSPVKLLICENLAPFPTLNYFPHVIFILIGWEMGEKKYVRSLFVLPRLLS